MTAHVHPSSSELLTALREPDRATSTLEHVNDCLACRVRLSRLRGASDPGPGNTDIFARIVEASTPLPATVADLVAREPGREPQPNEIWRVGRSEALLVWTRRVFDDGVADVVPLVLDVELADQETVLVPADATPLATETAAMVALRTHVHTGAFLNRVGSLDINREVTEVMTAVQEGRRPSGVRVGPPISDDRDQRLEYRQALRDLLAVLTPTAWIEAQHDAETGAQQSTNESIAPNPGENIDSIKARISERLYGASFIEAKTHTVAVEEHVSVTRAFKLYYLNTAILVATLDIDSEGTYPDTAPLAAACQKLALSEPDADAVAVAVPRDDWPAQLFPSAYLRTALQLPDGALAGPTATLADSGLVDILCKHLEGAVPAWEVTEPESSSIGIANLHQVAARHAGSAIEQITLEGRRARQTAKKAAWGSLPEELDERLATFVLTVINNDVRVALADLIRENSE